MPLNRHLLPRLCAITPSILTDETVVEHYEFAGDCTMWLQRHYREQLERHSIEEQRDHGSSARPESPEPIPPF